MRRFQTIIGNASLCFRMLSSQSAALSDGMAVQRLSFNCNGFLQVDALLAPSEVTQLCNIYDRFLHRDPTLKAGIDKHRYDLGSGETQVVDGVENITQIMWPSDILPELARHPLQTRVLRFVRELYNDASFAFDFDMLIAKAPRTATATPPHQDQAYWVELPDKRAVSVWIALDESTLDNGCMWYGPRTHMGPLRPHRRAGAAANAGLMCDATEDEMTPMPLRPGSAGLHAGRTLHYSRGNTTAGWRRAYILNYRPQAMIDAERAMGFDHGRSGQKVHEVRSKN